MGVFDFLINRGKAQPQKRSEPKDERKAECPYCRQSLAKIPGRKTKCPHCGKFMFVRTRPKDNVRVVVTKEEADKIDEEWAIVSGTHDEYIAEKVIDALNFGFPFSTAMLIKNEDFIFEILNIKNYTKRKDLERVRARIIGKKGKTLKTLSLLTLCYFELKDNYAGIIGDAEYIKNAQEAIIFLIKGAKQANVYSFLEKHQVKPVYDLGLKK